MSSIFFTTPPRVRLFAACARASAGGDDDERGDDDYAIERAISSILESAPETLSSVEENGVTPLMVAVEANNVAAVDALCRFARKEGETKGFVECDHRAGPNGTDRREQFGPREMRQKIGRRIRRGRESNHENWRQNGDDGGVRKR